MAKVLKGRRPKRARRFGGKIYHPRTSSSTKANATSISKALRKEGRCVRVVKGERGYDIYCTGPTWIPWSPRGS